MVDEFIVVRREYANGNTSWRPIAFIASIEPERYDTFKDPSLGKKYDLFAVIPPEGVSDIPHHLQWLGIHDGERITGCTSVQGHRRKFNWLEYWEGTSTAATSMMWRLEYYRKSVVMKILQEMFASTIGWMPKSDERIKIVLQALNKGKKNEIIDLEKKYSSIRCDTDLEVACLFLLRLACRSKPNAQQYYDIVQVLTVAAESFGGGARARVAKDIEFAETVRRHITLAKIMIDELIRLEKH